LMAFIPLGKANNRSSIANKKVPYFVFIISYLYPHIHTCTYTHIQQMHPRVRLSSSFLEEGISAWGIWRAPHTRRGSAAKASLPTYFITGWRVLGK
jgi:hypothetical protein